MKSRTSSYQSEFDSPPTPAGHVIRQTSSPCPLSLGEDPTHHIVTGPPTRTVSPGNCDCSSAPDLKDRAMRGEVDQRRCSRCRSSSAHPAWSLAISMSCMSCVLLPGVDVATGIEEMCSGVAVSPLFKIRPASTSTCPRSCNGYGRRIDSDRPPAKSKVLAAEFDKNAQAPYWSGRCRSE